MAAGPSPTAEVRGRGIVALDAAEGLPNPNPRQLALHLLGDVDDVRLRAYSPALVCLWQADSGPLGQGWNRVALDSRAWAPGLYYLSLSPRRGSVRGKAVLLRLLLTR